MPHLGSVCSFSGAESACPILDLECICFILNLESVCPVLDPESVRSILYLQSVCPEPKPDSVCPMPVPAPESVFSVLDSNSVFPAAETDLPEGAMLLGQHETLDGDLRHTDSYYVIPVSPTKEQPAVCEATASQQQAQPKERRLRVFRAEQLPTRRTDTYSSGQPDTSRQAADGRGSDIAIGRPSSRDGSDSSAVALPSKVSTVLCFLVFLSCHTDV